MCAREMTKEALLKTMTTNLEGIYVDDPELAFTQDEQYLLEKIETPIDLYHFLTTIEQIQGLPPEDFFGFILTLIVPELDYDPFDSVSDAYQKAINHVETPYSSMIPTRPQVSWVENEGKPGA